MLNERKSTVEESTGSKKNSLGNGAEIDEEKQPHGDANYVEDQGSHPSWYFSNKKIWVYCGSTWDKEGCGFDTAGEENVVAEVGPYFSQWKLNTVVVSIDSELQDSHN